MPAKVLWEKRPSGRLIESLLTLPLKMPAPDGLGSWSVELF